MLAYICCHRNGITTPLRILRINPSQPYKKETNVRRSWHKNKGSLLLRSLSGGMVQQKGNNTPLPPSFPPSQLLFLSLAATVKKARPDLLAEMANEGTPIPEEMPANFAEKQVDTIEDLGQPTTACFFTLSNVNPTGWYC